MQTKQEILREELQTLLEYLPETEDFDYVEFQIRLIISINDSNETEFDKSKLLELKRDRFYKGIAKIKKDETFATHTKDNEIYSSFWRLLSKKKQSFKKV